MIPMMSRQKRIPVLEHDGATTVAVSNDDTELKKDKVGNNKKADKQIFASLGYNRFRVDDGHKVGCQRLLKANLKTT